jgi:hypothetical protein
MKVPRQCPLVLLVKVGWRGGKTFGCEEVMGERWGRERSRAGFHCIQLNIQSEPQREHDISTL